MPVVNLSTSQLLLLQNHNTSLIYLLGFHLYRSKTLRVLNSLIKCLSFTHNLFNRNKGNLNHNHLAINPFKISFLILDPNK